MKTIGWTVKTKSGRIYQPWTFEIEEEAKDFCDELNEKCTPHKYIVAQVEIKVISPL